MVPFLVNAMCGVFSTAMFNESLMEGLQRTGNITTEDGGMFWQGYTAERSHIEFIDKETNEKIAECTATGPRWEDIEFRTYRQYESSFMGIEIGVNLEDMFKK